MNPQQVAEEKQRARSFVEAYHADLDGKKRSELENRYREESILTIHGEQFIKFPESVRQISTFDCQFSQPPGART